MDKFLPGKRLGPGDEHKLWLRFNLTEQDWNQKIKDCIRYLQSNEDTGALDLEALANETEAMYKINVITKVYMYLAKQVGVASE